jgi:hypothetical protein
MAVNGLQAYFARRNTEKQIYLDSESYVRTERKVLI